MATALPTPSFLAPVQGLVPGWVLLLSIAGVALLLMFAGRALVKVATFFIVGFAGAAVGYELALSYLPSAGGIQTVGVLLGFLVGGLLGVALIPIGIGLAIGFAAYQLATGLALSPAAALLVAAASLMVGLVLSGRILSVATAIAGGFLLFDALGYYGLGMTTSTLIAALLTLLGLWVQLRSGRGAAPRATAAMGGQPHD